jgi:hypothetical protein
MDSAQQQLVEKLKSSNNILLTVSRNPSVDQLSALLGLSLLLNKQGKHCAAVFSGAIPSTIEFLKPEDTIEKNTDSLRDFIIALDKNKADKLRYKVEDDVVRIFITPYKTSISQADLEFSQGDFNVDVVLALGVQDQADLDEAITAHGRILHDATVASISSLSPSNLGSINWYEQKASGVSELATDLAEALDPNLVDEQIATALLTGIVASTDRFSNDKTSSQTMSASAVLMAAGANQQLVATKLQEQFEAPAPENISEPESDQPVIEDEKPIEEPVDEPKPEPGTLEITHDPKPEQDTSEDKIEEPEVASEPAPEVDEPANIELPTPDEYSAPEAVSLPEIEVPSSIEGGLPLAEAPLMNPPDFTGALTATDYDQGKEPSTDPLSVSEDQTGILNRSPAMDQPEPEVPTPIIAAPTVDVAALTPPPADWSAPPVAPLPPVAPPVLNPPVEILSEDSKDEDAAPQLHISEDGTLTQLEEAVDSPHVAPVVPTPQLADAAREEVHQALNSAPATESQPPIEALNSQMLGPELHSVDPFAAPPLPPSGSEQVPPPVPPPINVGLSNPPT